MSTPTLADLVLQAGPAIRRSVRVAVDVEVIAYYPSTQTADVRPCVPDDPRQAPDGSITAATPPVIYAVPVRWPEGGGRALRWGLDPGDRCEGIVRHRSHDQVDSGAAVPVELLSLREFDLSDMVLYPGARPSTDELTAGEFRSDGQPVFVLPTGEALFVGASTASRALALAQETAARIERVEAYLNRATYSTPAGATVAPSPAPFSGTTSLFPTCVASVVVGSVAATTEAALRSTRIKVDT